MSYDLIWNFYCCCVRSQYMGKLDFISDSKHANLLRTQLLRDIGNSLKDLINAALPSSSRSYRNYRIKYIEDTDFGILEACLVSVASRILTESEKDPNLNECYRIAHEVMDNFTALQVLAVSSVYEAERNYIDEFNLRNKTNLQTPNSLVNEYVINQLSKSTPLLVSKLSNSSFNQGNQSNTPANFRIVLNIMKQFIPLPPKFESSSDTTLVESTLDHESSNEFIKHLSLSSTLLYQLALMDECLSRFEWSFVRYISKKVRTKREAEELQELTVLFSETLMWALSIGLIDPVALEDRDPVILLCLPRLAILIGCRLLHQCPIGIERIFSGQRLPKVFRSCLSELSLLNRQLINLSSQQWRIICTWLGPQGLPTSMNSLLFEKSPHIDSGSNNQEVDLTKKLAINYNFSGLHWLYKKVSSLADSISAENPSELRFILQKAIEMNDGFCEVKQQENEFFPKIKDYFKDDLHFFLNGQLENNEPKEEEIDRMESKYIVFPWWEYDWKTVIGFRQNLLLKNEKVTKEESAEMGVDFLALLDQVSEQNSENFGDLYCHETKLHSMLNDLLPDKISQADEGIHSFLEQESLVNDSSKNDLSCSSSISGVQNVNIPAPWQPDKGNVILKHETTRQSQFTRNEPNCSSDEAEEIEEEKIPIVTRLGPQGTICAHCFESFSILRRKHHCRRCGHIFCDSCSPNNRILPGLSGLQRVCLDCEEFLGVPVKR